MGGQAVNERVLNLLSMCLQAKEKGHHAFFGYNPHVTAGEIVITVHKDGWKASGDFRRFYISMDGVKRYMENTVDEVEAYLKGLIA